MSFTMHIAQYLRSADILLVRKTNIVLPIIPSYSVDQEKGKQEEQRLEKTGHYASIFRAINVFGIASEPVCDYLRCHHAFSVDGLRASKCKRKHPQNAIGV